MAKTRKLSAGLKSWNMHVKKVRAEMTKKGTFKKGDNLKKVLEEASKTYKKHKKGGADEGSEPTGVGADKQTTDASTTAATTGGRRGGKTRRHGGKKH